MTWCPLGEFEALMGVYRVKEEEWPEECGLRTFETNIACEGSAHYHSGFDTCLEIHCRRAAINEKEMFLSFTTKLNADEFGTAACFV